MKTYYLSLAILVALFAPSARAEAQTLAPNQNPNYAVSRDKYMRLADSINRWHSTTLQDTYSAPDWYEQKMQRREDRRDFRRQLRLERARYYWDYTPYYGYQHYRYDGNRHHRYYRPWWLWPY